MKKRYLFPHAWKPFGWILFLVGFVLGLLVLSFNWEPAWLDVTVFTIRYDPFTFLNQHKEPGWFKFTESNILDEIAATLVIVGGIIVSFSKVRSEDEYISEIRQRSLVWAFYVHYAVLLLCVLLVYDLPFFTVMVLTMFTPLLFFIVSFHLSLFRLRQKN